MSMRQWVASEGGLAAFIEDRVAEIRPLTQEYALSYWTASGSGKPEDYKAYAAAELALGRILSNRTHFEYLRELRETVQVDDPMLRRQLEVLYLGHLPYQVAPEITERIVRLSSSIEERFNTFRPAAGGRRLTDNEVDDVLKRSRDTTERRLVWEASKEIGLEVVDDLRELVKLRNETAQQLGYDTYYAMTLEAMEQDETTVFGLLDDVQIRVKESFHALKEELEQALSDRFKVPATALRPWHFEDRFFQHPPSAGSIDLDPFYADQDIVALAANFYDSIGLPAREVLARSDLHGREGKYQHAYCMDIDRQGDVRVMTSVQSDTYWMDTMLHELGHAVYSVGHDRNQSLPFLLREAAHTLTTEGIANLMGRLAHNARWLARFASVPSAKADRIEKELHRRSRLGALVFAQWCQVMAHFEQELYRDPDQDLNTLWWEQVGQFQGLTPPDGRDAPDWASKIHLVSSPVYYHNYLLGELYQAQLHASLVERFFAGEPPEQVIYADHPEVGEYLDSKVFQPGSRWRWDRFVVESTGAPLSTDAFARAYVD